jgi:hypothetical protein
MDLKLERDLMLEGVRKKHGALVVASCLGHKDMQ